MQYMGMEPGREKPLPNKGAGEKGKSRVASSRLSWHNAFVGAIQLELEEYLDYLEFIPEFPLTTEPLRIDCVIIKKPKDLVIEKNIAAIFREANLLEYKSPGHNVSIADFYKVYAYACLYAYIKRSPMVSLTITFIASHYPRALLLHLKYERGYNIEEKSPGIYTVEGDILPIQIIDSRRLSTDENLWLKGLRKELSPLDVLKIGDKISGHDKSLAKVYFNVVSKANAVAIMEAMKMRKAAITLDEVLISSGLVARAEARAEARGVAIGEKKWRESEALDIAQNMINLGFPQESIVSATRLDPDKVKKLYRKKHKVTEL